MDPLVSIIVPIYKVEEYLHRCVDSILNQTYSNLEIILVDDGSPDNCWAICDSYAEKDSRISVIHKKNGGLADARNAGIRQASGTYITHIDSDDFVTQDYVETLLNLCVKYDADISVSDTHYYKTEKDLFIPDNPISEIIFDNVSAIKQMLYQKEFDTGAWAKMYHRRLYTGIEYSVEFYFEDLATTYKLMQKSNKVVFTNKRTYYYFQRQDSITGMFNAKKMDILPLSQVMIDDLNKIDSNLLIPVYGRIVSLCFAIALQIKNEDPDFKRLWREIKKYRLIALKDPNARMKTRVACFVTFLGVGSTRILYKLVDKRR